MEFRKEIDCGNKTCLKHEELRDSCVIFLPTPVANCNIPCDFTGCKIAIKYNFQCDIWRCFDKQTTTTSTVEPWTSIEPITTTSTSTTTSGSTSTEPWEPIGPSAVNSTGLPIFCPSFVVYGTIGVNLILLLFVYLLCICVCRKIL